VTSNPDARMGLGCRRPFGNPGFRPARDERRRGTLRPARPPAPRGRSLHPELGNLAGRTQRDVIGPGGCCAKRWWISRGRCELGTGHHWCTAARSGLIGSKRTGCCGPPSTKCEVLTPMVVTDATEMFAVSTLRALQQFLTTPIPGYAALQPGGSVPFAGAEWQYFWSVKQTVTTKACLRPPAVLFGCGAGQPMARAPIRAARA